MPCCVGVDAAGVYVMLYVTRPSAFLISDNLLACAEELERFCLEVVRYVVTV